jgi:DHA2 family multidrug resistance protein-like MFS transporter
MERRQAMSSWASPVRLARMTNPVVDTTRAGQREWWGLAVLALPVLLLSTDLSVLFLALPSLAADLELSGVAQLWTVDSYGFMVAGFLVTMGTLGDRIGHRRLLLAGAAGFGAASVVAAFAPNATVLIAARALLGVAGAALAPTTLALITRMFADARQRAVAVAVWSGCFMGGAVLGPVVGGLLLGRFWWGTVFLLAVPVAALLLAAGPVLLPEHRGRSGRLDLVSVGQSLGAVLPIVYGVKELTRGGARTVPLVAIAAGVLIGVLFVRRQRRLPDPLLDLGLFRQSVLRDTVLISALVGALQGGGLLVANTYLQRVAGLPPLAAGLRLVPPAIAMLVGIAVSTRLARTRTIAPGPLIAYGLGCSALGNVVVATGHVVPGLCLVMAGVGPMVSLGYGLVVAAAPRERAGSAAAVMETGGQLGIAVGIAVLGSVATVGSGAPDRLVPVAVVSAVMFGVLSGFAAASLRPTSR